MSLIETEMPVSHFLMKRDAEIYELSISRPNGKRIKRKVIAGRFGLSISRIKGIVAKERDRRFGHE